MPDDHKTPRERLNDLLKIPMAATTTSVVSQLVETRLALYQYLAHELEGALERHFAAQPEQQQTVQEKRMLVRQVNSWIRDLGLAVVSAEGKAGMLMVKRGPARDVKGLFAVNHFDGTRTLGFSRLESVKLCRHRRKEVFVELWTERLAGKNENASAGIGE